MAKETGTTQAGTNRFCYIGGYQDTTSTGADGYYKLGARYYDGRGHFTQPDALAGSINDPKTMTAYNYAGGDPVNFSDPSGYSVCSSVLEFDPVQCLKNTGASIKSKIAENAEQLLYSAVSCGAGSYAGIMSAEALKTAIAYTPNGWAFMAAGCGAAVGFQAVL